MIAECWQITLLGTLRAEREGRALEHFKSRRIAALLAYLALFPDLAHPRDTLVELFWPEFEAEAARASLRASVSWLRARLEPPGTRAQSVLVANRTNLGLRAVETDVDRFEDALQRARDAANPAERTRELSRAVTIYGGDLLPNLEYDWVQRARQRLREEYRAASSELSGLTPSARPGGKPASESRCTRARQRDREARVRSLPVPLTPFFGREQESQCIEELLLGTPSCDRPRLLTLIGPGGTGKTRMALEAARRLVQPFSGAVWFVALADVVDASAVPDAIGDALKIRTGAGAAGLAAIATALGNRPGLLVLDNFEHLVDGGAAFVHELLRAAPAAVILVTSRVRLDIEGERALTLLPLPTPPDVDATPLELLEFPSVRMFIDRAQAARPDFQLTLGNSAVVAELARRLEGLPLALELAASWAQTLTPLQMLERTRDRLDGVVSRPRGGSERHRSLRAATDWSYRLLSPSLQELFARVSVFRGGWTVETAAAITDEKAGSTSDERSPAPEEPLCADLAHEKLLDNLARLAEASLIYTEELALHNGPEMRFRMLETLREFGAEQLAAPERETLSRRHAEHFTEVAEEFAVVADPLDYNRLEPEFSNLRAALRWCLDRPDAAELGLRLAVAMKALWVWRGRTGEGRTAIELLLTRVPPSAALLAKALRVAGNLCYYGGDHHAALSYHAQHLEAARALGDEREVGFAHLNIGASQNELRQFQEALPHHVECLAILRRLETNSVFVAGALHNLADCLKGLGECQAARSRFVESLRAYEEIGSHGGMALNYRGLAELEVQEGNLEAAWSLLEPAIELCRRFTDLATLPQTLAEAAAILSAIGRHAEARGLRLEREALLEKTTTEPF